MAFADLTITRNDVDAFEGQTFVDVNVTSGTTLVNISEKDNLVVDKAKRMLQTDILEELRHYINDATYATETVLLDAVDTADSEDMLKDLLTYKFLELWFSQDATHKDSYAYVKAGKYYRMYNQYLPAHLRRISGLLAKPKSVRRVQFQSMYR